MLHLISCAAAAALLQPAIHVRYINNTVIISALTHTHTLAHTDSTNRSSSANNFIISFSIVKTIKSKTGSETLATPPGQLAHYFTDNI